MCTPPAVRRSHPLIQRAHPLTPPTTAAEPPWPLGLVAYTKRATEAGLNNHRIVVFGEEEAEEKEEGEEGFGQ